MTSMEKKNKFLQEVRDYEYRHEYVSANIVNGLAFQIGLMREAQEWSHDELAERCGETSKSISRIENPNCEDYSLDTLLQLAKAFDVALLVRFAPFSELADWVINLSDEKLIPLSYENEQMNLFSQYETDDRHEDFEQSNTWLPDLAESSATETSWSSGQKKVAKDVRIPMSATKHDANNFTEMGMVA